jgi:hypothetical protein
MPAHLIRMPKFGSVIIPDGENPRMCGWLVPGDNCTPLGYRIVRRAWQDNGIEETPEGSNLGVRIEAMTKWAGLTPPAWWCAIWVGCVFTDAGSLVPAGFPATKNWLPFLERETYVPKPGDAILYGTKNGHPWEDRLEWMPHHIGILGRTMVGNKRLDMPRTIEGNRAWGGSTSNNGQAVDYAPQGRKDILGYIVASPIPEA